jgi:hypothetical protein
LQRDAEALTEEQRQLGEELDARSAAEFNRAQEEKIAANFILSVLIAIGILAILLIFWINR